jgi:predicted NAD/FAD-binding protein
MAFRQVFVTIVYSHVRSELRRSNRASPRHARSNASWSASSASCSEPSIR